MHLYLYIFADIYGIYLNAMTYYFCDMTDFSADINKTVLYLSQLHSYLPPLRNAMLTFNTSINTRWIKHSSITKIFSDLNLFYSNKSHNMDVSSQAAKKSWHSQKDSLLIWCGNSESRSEVLLNVMIFRELWLAEKKYTYAVSGLREASCFK